MAGRVLKPLRRWAPTILPCDPVRWRELEHLGVGRGGEGRRRRRRGAGSLQLLVLSHLEDRRSAGGTNAQGGHAETHLAPQQFSNTNEETPKPLGQGELCTAEGLATKFHYDNLEQRKRQRKRGQHVASPPAQATKATSPQPQDPIVQAPIFSLGKEEGEIQKGRKEDRHGQSSWSTRTGRQTAPMKIINVRAGAQGEMEASCD